MKIKINVSGTPYLEDGGFSFSEASPDSKSINEQDLVIEVDADRWRRWTEVQDYVALYKEFAGLAIDETVRIGKEEELAKERLAADIQKLKTGQYRLVPVEREPGNKSP